jgi:hypothetical protein
LGKKVKIVEESFEEEDFWKLVDIEQRILEKMSLYCRKKHIPQDKLEMKFRYLVVRGGNMILQIKVILNEQDY